MYLCMWRKHQRGFVLYNSSWVGVSFTQNPSHGADVRCKLFLVSSCSSSLENVSPGTKFTDIAGLVRRICSCGLCFAHVRRYTSYFQSPDAPCATGRSGSDLNVSMDQNHRTPPKRTAEAKPVVVLFSNTNFYFS